MTHEVVVTGLGLVTPAGIGVDDNWSSLCSGRSAASPDPALADLDVDFSCRVPGFDPEAFLDARKAWRLDRCIQLGIAAAAEAVKDSGLDPSSWDAPRVGVVMGGTAGGPRTWEQQHLRLLEGKPVSPLFLPASLVNMLSGEIAIEFGATGTNLVTSAACASGAMAIGVGRMLISSGACDIVIAGGAESGITPLFVSGFRRMGALSRRREAPEHASRPFDAGRDGFVMGEGAAVLILERRSHAQARCAPIRAAIAGFAATGDGYHSTTPDPSGAAVERAMRQALADGGLSPQDIDHVNAHGTSTPYNDRTEAAVIERVLGTDTAVTSTKGVTGHMLSAAGAAEAAYTVLAIQHQLVPPTANLEKQDPEIDVNVVSGQPLRRGIQAAISDSFGFGGQNTIVVVTQP